MEQLLSESLTYAPTRSPTDVFLTVDSLSLLSQKWGLSKLDVYEERRLVEDANALSYLKSQLSALKSRRGREDVWIIHNDGMGFA